MMNLQAQDIVKFPDYVHEQGQVRTTHCRPNWSQDQGEPDLLRGRSPERIQSMEVTLSQITVFLVRVQSGLAS